jgi:uncharacterized membrane protein
MRLMRFLTALLLSMLASSLPFAASNDTPPTVPSGAGLLFCKAVFSNGTSAAGAPLILLAVSNSSQTVFRLIADSSGGFVLPLSPSQYEFDALIDYPESGGIDFASTVSSNLAHSSNSTFVFYPAGSVSGKVLLSGKPVSNATVRANCPSPAFDYARINGGEAVRSGEAGEFILKALPAGSCMVSAHSGSGANSAEVLVEGGRSKQVDIELSPPTQPPPAQPQKQDGIPSELAVAALAIIAIAAFLLSRKKEEPRHGGAAESREELAGKKAGQKEKAAAKRASGKAAAMTRAAEKTAKTGAAPSHGLESEKAKAVLSTLTDREAEIVRHLLSAGGKAKRSSLQHKLLIPKTSLLRNLRSLERKNIVKLTPFGRNLLAELNRGLFE